MLKRENVNVALVPISALFFDPDLRVAVNLGIAARGKVKSVLLFYKGKLSSLSKIFADHESQTSINLLKVLMMENFGFVPEIEKTDFSKYHYTQFPASLVIGDKALVWNRNCCYTRGYSVVDLAYWWFSMTQLPMVFAAWIAKSKLSSTFTSILTESYYYGRSSIDEIIQFATSKIVLPRDYLENYFIECLDYELSSDHLNSIKLFLQYLEKVI